MDRHNRTHHSTPPRSTDWDQLNSLSQVSPTPTPPSSSPKTPAAISHRPLCSPQNLSSPSINLHSSHKTTQNHLSIPPLIAKIAKKAHTFLNQPVFTFQPSREHLPYTTAVVAPFIRKLRNDSLYVANFNDLLNSPNYNSPDHRAWQAEAINFFSLVLGLDEHIPSLALLPEDDISNGHYDDSTDSVHLKQYYPDFCQAEQLNTIAHETFHAYQHCQRLYRRNSLDGFCYNKYFYDYQKSKHTLPFLKNSHTKYLNQVVEREARCFGEQVEQYARELTNFPADPHSLS